MTLALTVLTVVGFALLVTGMAWNDRLRALRESVRRPRCRAGAGGADSGAAALPGAARAAAATWGLAAAALLAATPAPAQDLVILRDGARQAGTLASCVGEVCVLDGRQLPKGEIAWVGLGREGAPPASATGGELDEVHLASGEAVPGTVVGVSLGTVAMASGSYDRREVAWIRFAGAEAPRHDILVLRGGGALEGELRSCVGETCTLESQSVPLAGIAWIGLAVAEVAPPGGGVPAEGVLHLVDGTETAGRLVGISAGQVVSDRGSYPRQQVAWVGVPVPEPDRGPQPGQIGAPLPDPTSPGPGSPAAPLPDPTSPGPGSPAPPTPDPTPTPPPPPPPAPGAGTSGAAGASWSGTVTQTTSDRKYGILESEFTIEVRLREGAIETWLGGRTIELVSEGSTMSYRYRSSDGLTHCSGEGTAEVRAGQVAFIMVKELDTDVSPWLGVDYPIGAAIYTLSFEPVSGARYTLQCRSTEGAWQSSESFPMIAGVIGTYPLVARSQFACPGDGEVRMLDGGRMSGSFTCTRDDATHTTSWSICREGVACAPPPAPPGASPPPEDDPCEELARRLAALRGRHSALADVWRAEQQAFNEATARRDAARDAIWGADGALAAYFDSVLELTALGAKGAWSKIAAMARKGRELLAAGNADQLQQELTEFVISQELGDVPKKIFDQEAVRLAGEAANAYLQATGDRVGADRMYQESLKVHTESFGTVLDAVKAFKLGMALPGHYEKTQHLGDLVSEYFGAAEDAAGLEQQMNATNEQMAEIQEEISSILERCPELAPSSGEEEVAARASPRALYQIAAVDFQGPGGAVSAAVDREAIGAELAELAALQRALMGRLVGDVLPPLLPFITGVWQEVDPVLLEGLLTAVAPALDAVELDLEALVTRSEALAAALRSGGP